MSNKEYVFLHKLFTLIVMKTKWNMDMYCQPILDYFKIFNSLNAQNFRSKTRLL